MIGDYGCGKFGLLCQPDEPRTKDSFVSIRRNLPISVGKKIFQNCCCCEKVKNNVGLTGFSCLDLNPR
jgi:hypothetical protein